MDLRTILNAEHGQTIAKVVGTVDAMTAHRLRIDLTRGLTLAEHGLVVDLSRVGFMDSAGLRVLIAVRRNARLHGKSLALVGPRPQIRKLLQASGFYGYFDIRPMGPRPVGGTRRTGR
ncbi:MULTISPECIES: STAS domain-containing protein [Thermomonospora]|uniref:Anti-sigma factor antagonist n=1 Tax=Thermomonospora cellulosilytica TaxID=1411118 RepID=A0A7W3N026_9ACTN|nr:MULTISPECIES: STAS domain-containing protein [Thermomonospora]MBA9005033.1 anti-anti-sigma factor [Thermomonospora cellulosilytica]